MRRATAFLLAVVVAGSLSSCVRPGSLTIYAEFENVGDLVVRANVQSRDAVVGTVLGIDLVDRRGEPGWMAKVTLSIDEGVPVPEGTTAVVRSTSLLGEKFVGLVPPPDAGADTPALRDGAVIRITDTHKAPELEAVFQELGALLASGALTDLGAFVTAQARILEGQEADVERVLDGTARVLSSLASEREAIAQSLENLSSASRTLAGGTETTDRFLVTSEETLRILADQRGQLEELLVQLDRFSAVGARLLSQHSDDVDRQIKALLQIIPALHEARGSIDQVLPKIAPFTTLFARAAPGDYIQLDITFENPVHIVSDTPFSRLWGPAGGLTEGEPQ